MQYQDIACDIIATHNTHNNQMLWGTIFDK